MTHEELRDRADSIDDESSELLLRAIERLQQRVSELKRALYESEEDLRRCRDKQFFGAEFRKQLDARMKELEAAAARGEWFMRHAYLDFDPDIPAWVMRLDGAVVPHDRVFSSDKDRVDAAINAAEAGE